jgi:hypothetical protein
MLFDFDGRVMGLSRVVQLGTSSEKKRDNSSFYATSKYIVNLQTALYRLSLVRPMSSKLTRFGIKNRLRPIIWPKNRRGMFIANSSAGGRGNMKILNVKNIGGSLLGLMLLFGTFMFAGTTAQAQYWPNQDQIRRQRQYERERQRQIELERQRQWQIQQQQQGYYNNGRWDNRGRRGRNDNYGNYGGSYELRQTALNAGYNEGVKAGRNDRRHGRFNPQGSGAFRSANKDYNSRYGDRYAYQQYFRQAFINGYSDGYNYGY